MVQHARIEHVKEQLSEQGKDALLVADEANSHYFSGFHTVSDGNYPLVLIPQDGDATLFVSALDEDAAAYASHIDIKVPDGSFVKAVTETLSDDAEILVSGNVNVRFYNKLTEYVDVGLDEDIIAQMRHVKSTEEVAHIQKAYDIADTALNQLAERITLGINEVELAAKLEYLMRKQGSDGVAFPTIVATGASASMPHHITSDVDLCEGPLLFDIGATIHGYRSDMSRTYYLGEPSKEFREVYEIVQEAQQRAESVLSPGIAAKDVDAAARGYIEENGYGDEFMHSTGHGVGLDVHEAPNLSPRNEDDTLDEGMIVTLEPGIYLKGQFGVRIEDAYRITENGAERLTTSSRELKTIPVSGEKE